MDMKQFYLKSLFLSLLMIVVGSISANAEEETIATFTASDYKSGTTGGWNVSNANYATAGGGYYQLTYGNASIVSPSINFSNYSDITITISARKYGGPDATQSKISVSQGETELASYSPSGTSIAASSALAISPAGGTITVSCPGASGGKGCGVQSIVIKGTPKAVSKTLSSISLFGTYPTTFNVGDTFSHEGMTVTATYDDNTSEDVTAYATFDGYDMSKADTYEVTVSYTEREVTKTATYDITVNAVAVTGITLDQEAIQLKAGKTKQLTATVTPDNATNKTVAWSSSDESVATVSEDGTVTAVAEGTATITATANGGENITATCVVTVPAPLVATGYYEKVTTAPSDWSGEYLIVYEEGSVAFNGGLSTLDVVGNTIEVVMDDNKIEATEETDAAAFTIAKNADGAYTIKSASGKYIGVSSNSNGLKQTDNASTYTHHLSIDDDENAVIKAAFSGSNMSLRYNYANNQTRFRYYSNGQQPIQLYKKVTTTTNQYTLVAGTEEYPFEGLTLTKELPAQTDFYIKDGNGKEYHSTDAQTKLTIIAENHENLPTSAEGENFYLSKANTWVFTLTEGEGGAVTLTVSPQTAGETKYMLASDYHQVSNDVFDANNQLTKEMTKDGFYITRTDDYGITNLTAAESNVSDYYIWEFSDDAETVGYIPGKIINVYRVSKAGSYTFTLDLENKTLTAELVSENQYTLVAGDQEYPFEGLTLTQALPEHTQFYVKDSNENVFHSTDSQTQLIINAENHENLPTSAEGNDFYLSKANTWVFTLTEGEGGAVTLTVNPETPGATQYMLSETYLTASDAIFDASYKLTKEMTTDEFYIVRSDDYGLTNLTPANFNAPEDRRYWIFSEDAPTVEFITGEIRGSYTVAEAGLYNITLDLTNSTVTAVATSTVTAKGNLNNTDTGVFAGVTGFTTGTNSASGTLKTGVGDVTVDYAGKNNKSYLNDKHIRTYDNGTTLKFTAPEGYVLTGIDITFSSGDPRNLTTTPNDTYTSNTESNLGSWSGGTRGAKTVTFTGQNATSYLTTAEVTLMKASLSPKLAGIDVEGYTTDFVVGDTYIFDGTATVTYEDGSTKEVTSEVEVFGPDMSTAGDKSANISYTENGLSVVAVISIHVREPQDITFRKITSTDELVAGKRYVIVDENHNVAMGACYAPSSTTSYFTKYDATFSYESVTLKEGKANANILTLGGEEGAWTFATSIESNKYLAYTGSSNSLESGANAAEASAQWTITFDEDGNARILNTNESGRYIRYNSGADPERFACYRSTENHPYGSQNAVQLYVESDLEDVTLTISAAGYATLYYSDRALKVPEDVTAKTYKVVDGKLAESKTYASGSKIPKGEAVVLKGAPGEYTFKVTSTPEPKDADNMLKGSDVEEPTTGGNYYYALQAKAADGSGGPGMYWMVDGGGAFMNGAHKAYMALPEMFDDAQEVGGAKSFYLFEDATGIYNAQADGEAAKMKRFNMSGQRVGSNYKGIVIVNGKKIVRK